MDTTPVYWLFLGLLMGLVLTISGAPATTASPGLYCHVCADATDDDACNATQQCDPGRVCLTSLWYDEGHRTIQKRCAAKQICNSMEKHNDKICYNMADGFDGICSFCCDTPGCNRATPKYATTQQASPPEPTLRHPTQPTRSQPINRNSYQQVPQESCKHNEDDHRVISVDGGHGMKISINLEFPNGMLQPQPSCGCQQTTRTTQHPSTSTTPTALTTTSAPETPTAMAPTPTTTAAAKPTTTVAKATTTAAAKPTTTVAKATTTAAAKPTTTVAKPTTTVAKPTTTVAKPTTTVAKATTTLKRLLTTTAGPAGPKCYTCKDQSCRSQTVTTCSSAESLCINTLTQDINGDRTFNKGCASEEVCKKDWFQGTSGLADCYLLDDSPTGSPGLALSKCSFCCQGDGCNQKAVPMNKLWYPAS